MNKNGGELPRLVPVSVPWQISASAAYLRVEMGEVQGDVPARVDFIGFFKGNQNQSSGETGATVEVVKAPPPFKESKGSAQGVYHQIRVIFRLGYWLRCSPGHSESQVIETAAYDWSEVSARLLPGEKLHENLARVALAWRQSGICPNPRMYEVAASPWLRQLGLEKSGEWKHFLLAGSEALVEIVAQNWEWRLGQAVQ